VLIPDRIKEERLKNGLTQQELANILNLTKTSICCYEKGKRTPNIDTLEDIANAFNVTTDYLLGRDTNVMISDTKLIPFAKEDIKLIEELRKKPNVYSVVMKDPKRTVELLAKKAK